MDIQKFITLTFFNPKLARLNAVLLDLIPKMNDYKFFIMLSSFIISNNINVEIIFWLGNSKCKKILLTLLKLICGDHFLDFYK